MPAHGFGDVIIELAQPVGLQRLIGRVDGGGGSSRDLREKVETNAARSMTTRERPQQRETCR